VKHRSLELSAVRGVAFAILFGGAAFGFWDLYRTLTDRTPQAVDAPPTMLSELAPRPFITFTASAPGDREAAYLESRGRRAARIIGLVPLIDARGKIVAIARSPSLSARLKDGQPHRLTGWAGFAPVGMRVAMSGITTEFIPGGPPHWQVSALYIVLFGAALLFWALLERQARSWSAPFLVSPQELGWKLLGEPAPRSWIRWPALAMASFFAASAVWFRQARQLDSISDATLFSGMSLFLCWSVLALSSRGQLYAQGIHLISALPRVNAAIPWEAVDWIRRDLTGVYPVVGRIITMIAGRTATDAEIGTGETSFGEFQLTPRTGAFFDLVAGNVYGRQLPLARHAITNGQTVDFGAASVTKDALATATCSLDRGNGPSV
jgi:hypothetical protein